MATDDLSGFTKDVRNNFSGLATLYTRLATEVYYLSERFGKELGIESPPVFNRVMERVKIARVAGVLTIANETHFVDRSGRKQIIDRDILAGALERPYPVRALGG